MTEETKTVKEVNLGTDTTSPDKSLGDLLGINFNKDGSWTANEVGNIPVMRRLNRKERRKRDALERKSKK